MLEREFVIPAVKSLLYIDETSRNFHEAVDLVMSFVESSVDGNFVLSKTNDEFTKACAAMGYSPRDRRIIFSTDSEKCSIHFQEYSWAEPMLLYPKGVLSPKKGGNEMPEGDTKTHTEGNHFPFFHRDKKSYKKYA